MRVRVRVRVSPNPNPNQEPPLLAGTLRDNIAIGRPGASEEELRAAAAAAGCDFAAADWEREASTDAALALRLSPSRT